jgi:hypothetical protein
MVRAFLALVVGMAVVPCAVAFEGWRLIGADPIPGKGSAWDYVAVDPSARRLYIGHRKEGLQVFDIAAHKLVGTVAGTAEASSNGATLMPEFDLAISNNENGTIIPFSMSGLTTQSAIKLGEALDTSHYDPVTKRILVNMEAGADGTELVVIEAPSLAKVGTIKIASKKPEHADGDGAGSIYLAARDNEKVYKIDLRAMKVTAEFDTTGCGQTNSLAVDRADHRLLLGCRGNARLKPSFTVMDANTGRTVFSEEIGGGNDGIAYDPQRKHIFLTNGVNAVMSIFEQTGPDSYKQIEALGTQSGVRTLAYDSQAERIYSVTAEGTADFSRKINTAASPWYANVFFPDTFKVLTYGKP